jgi:sugar phosphate isomerase/epimerase
LPGLGELNWTKFFSNLDEINYQRTISIEHEDPVWEGTPSKVKQGIQIARDYIKQVPPFQVR